MTRSQGYAAPEAVGRWAGRELGRPPGSELCWGPGHHGHKDTKNALLLSGLRGWVFPFLFCPDLELQVGVVEEVGQKDSLLEDADGSVALGGCLEAPVGPVDTSVLWLLGARVLDAAVGGLC